MSFLQKVDRASEKGLIPKRFAEIFKRCYLSYLDAIGDEATPIFEKYYELIAKQCNEPYTFSNYNAKNEEYEKFGRKFIGSLIEFENSKLRGHEHIDQIAKQIAAGENVVLLANHQTEPDPQVLQLMLLEKYPQLANNLTFVAGDRVTTDPMAVPASLGCNLFCIYSKKHMDHPPEKKADKVMHNRRTMKVMGEKLEQGGMCIYVAPSGGRDRPNAEGILEVAPFDPQSVEMLYLVSKSSKTPTHFYPLALNTYDIFPPPDSVDIELGEERRVSKAPVIVSFGPEVEMESFPGSDEKDKKLRRKLRTDYIFNQVKSLYV